MANDVGGGTTGRDDVVNPCGIGGGGYKDW